MIKIIKLIFCILVLFHSTETATEVSAKGGHSSSSRSSRSSSRTSSISSSSRGKSYVYTYSTYRSPRTFTNRYYNTITMRTYHPLTSYYHPIIYNVLGYYSLVYHLKYYDGYGYNFYYGGYGYYEHSVYDDLGTTGSGLVWIIVIVVLLCFCCGCGAHTHHRRRNYIVFESERSPGSGHSGYKVEEVVITQEMNEQLYSPPVPGYMVLAGDPQHAVQHNAAVNLVQYQQPVPDVHMQQPQVNVQYQQPIPMTNVVQQPQQQHYPQVEQPVYIVPQYQGQRYQVVEDQHHVQIGPYQEYNDGHHSSYDNGGHHQNYNNGHHGGYH